MRNDHVSKHLGPRTQAVKGTEMTVRRALAIISVFDALEKGQDWTDADPRALRKAMGDDTFDPHLAVWPELWARYRDKSLHRQTKDLAANLNMEGLSAKSRKEIQDGINRIG